MNTGKSEQAFRELEATRGRARAEELRTYRITYTDGTRETIEANRMKAAAPGTSEYRVQRLDFFTGYGEDTRMVMSVISGLVRSVRDVTPAVSAGLTVDECHVLLDTVSAYRYPEQAEPWTGYETGPAEDPKAGEAGWNALLHSAEVKLGDIISGSI